MKKISQTLSYNLTVYKSKNNNILKLYFIDNIKLIISYFNKYPLIGIKNKDFQDFLINSLLYHNL